MTRRGTFFTFVSAAYENNNNTPTDGFLYRWDQTTPATQVTDPTNALLAGGYSILEMAAGARLGYSFTLALRSDFTLWGWGDTAGYLYTTTPTQMSFSLATSIVHVAADTEASFAIDDTGRVWGWGNPFAIGLGGFVASAFSTPILVSTTGSFTSIHTRGSSALALRSDGKLVGWGDNSQQQLGINGNGDSPQIVSTTVTFVKFRVGGSGFPSVAIGNINGILHTWGRNLESQCGVNPATGTISSPLGITTSFIDALGMLNAGIGIKAITGDVWTWGAGQTSYSPAWHSGTTHLLTNRSFATPMVSFARSTLVPYAFDSNYSVWGWGGVPVGTGANATSIPTMVSTSTSFQSFHDVVLFGGTIAQALT